MKLAIATSILFFLFNNQISAQTNPIPEPESQNKIIAMPISNLEYQLSITVLVFGILVISLEIYLIRSNKISSEDTVKFIIITLIIISTLYLITAGYNNNQIAPAVGLLGTIAGYLLGKIENKTNEK